jgi:hypothetical protein
MGGLTLPPASPKTNNSHGYYQNEQETPMPLTHPVRSDVAACMGTDKNLALRILAQASKHRGEREMVLQGFTRDYVATDPRKD